MTYCNQLIFTVIAWGETHQPPSGHPKSTLPRGNLDDLAGTYPIEIVDFPARIFQLYIYTLWLCQNSYWQWWFFSWIYPLMAWWIFPSFFCKRLPGKPVTGVENGRTKQIYRSSSGYYTWISSSISRYIMVYIYIYIYKYTTFIRFRKFAAVRAVPQESVSWWRSISETVTLLSLGSRL